MEASTESSNMPEEVIVVEAGQKRKSISDSEDSEQKVVQDQEKSKEHKPKQPRQKRVKGRLENDFRDKNDISNAEYIVENGN